MRTFREKRYSHCKTLNQDRFPPKELNSLFSRRGITFNTNVEESNQVPKPTNGKSN